MSRICRSCAVVMFALISSAGNAMPQAGSMKDVLMGALASNKGVVEVVVVGQLADRIRAQIQRPDAKVVAKAKVIAPLAIENCSVVEVSFSTPGTRLKTPSGDMRELDLRMNFNVCKNGTLLSRDEVLAASQSPPPSPR